MGTITRGQTFGATETITNTKLHTLVDDATVTGIVNADVSAGANIDSSKINLASSGYLTTGAAFTITGVYTYSTAPVFSVAPNLPADTIDAITEIKSTLKSGDDVTLITGTAAAANKVAMFNGDGDLVDSTKTTADLTQSLGSWASKTIGTSYLAATDGFVQVFTGYCQNSTQHIYSDSSNPPTTVRAAGRHDGTTGINSLTSAVKLGDYYKATSTGSTTGNETMFWIPLS